MKKENILNVLLVVIIGVLVVVGTVSAATTISTDISTEGVLTVSGTASSTFVGALGVGTTTPWAKFSINPNSLGSGIPEFAIGSSSLTHFVVDGGGKVGVGTAVPDSKLVVSGSETSAHGVNSAIKLINTSSTNGNSWSIRAGGVGTFTPDNGLSIADDSNYMFFITGDSNHNVGIGTSTPNAKLAVRGGNSDSAYSALNILNSSNSSLFLVRNDGKIGIGTTTPVTKLHVSNGASATTTVSIGELGLSSSKSCINVNASDGSAGSFYMNAAHQIVAEANYCR